MSGQNVGPECRARVPVLEKPEALETHHLAAGNNQMIVKRHRNQRQRRAKFGCHIDIGARRLGLAAGMIMDEDHRLA